MTLRSPFTSGFGRTEANELSSKLKALAEPNRLLILAQLAESGTLTNAQLTEALKGKQATISHHVHVLLSAGLIVKGKRGSEGPLWLDRAVLDGVSRLLSPGADR